MLAALAVPTAQAASGVPAAGGAPLLAAAGEALAIVLAVVRAPRRLDDRAWLARFEVERSLAGSPAAGDRVAVAWDEPARGRAPRFVEGTRVLVALAPLPAWSVWRERLDGREALGVAREGDAFLRDPSEADITLLARWLDLPEASRGGPAGVAVLAALVAHASPPLAGAALERLEATPGLATRLSPEAHADLAGALGDTGRPEALRQGVLDLVGARGLAGLRPAVAALGAPGAPLAAEAQEALARLDGGLDAERVHALLARSEAGVRAVALRHAPASLEPDPARTRLAEDPAPEVRAAAARALARRRGMAAWDVLAPHLDDPDDVVRGAAIRALGGLGAPAVPRLVARARKASGVDAARPALLALALAGPDGARALHELAAAHPDARVRAMARFLLGRPPEGH